MGAPAGLSAAVAALALAVAAAAYSAFRLAAVGPRGRRLQNDVDLSHVLMGTAMAGMAVSCLNILPAVACEGVFGVEALWFASAMARSARLGEQG